MVVYGRQGREAALYVVGTYVINQKKKKFEVWGSRTCSNKGESATRLSDFNPNKAQRSKMTSKTSMTDVLGPGRVVDLDWAIGSAVQKRTGRYWALPESPSYFLLLFFFFLSFVQASIWAKIVRQKSKFEGF